MQAGTLTFGGQTRRLPHSLVRFLEAVADHRGSIVHVDSLCARLWPGRDSQNPSRVAAVYLCRLRRCLRAFGWPDPISSSYGGGRRLCMPVEVLGIPNAVVIPGTMRDQLVRLLYAHPDHRSADRFLQLIVQGTRFAR